MDPPLSYINLDLWVERDEGGAYVIRGKSPQADLRDAAVGDLATLGIHDERLAANTADAEYVKTLGRHLHRFLFQTRTDARIQSMLDRCLGASGEDCGVRIRLRLANVNPEIAAIPWEFLYAESEGGFLASSERTSVVRFIEGMAYQRKPEARLPLDMLVVIPSVPDLDVDGEKRRINEALEGIDPPVSVTFLEGAVTRFRLSDALRNESFDFLHFVGHGDFESGRGRLRLNRSELEPDWIDEEALAELLKNHRTLKLVVLNTCRGSGLSTSRAFAGLAPQLVLAGVPAVVAMQYPITDAEALAFVHAFYRSLFQGSGRGSVDAAIAAARSALSRDFPGTRAVGLPALFMRYEEGVLFKVVAGADTRPESYTRAEASKDLGIIQNASTAIVAIVGEVERAEQIEILERAKARLRYRNRVVLSPILIFLAVVLAAAGNLFDRVPLTWIAAASPVWFGDPLANTLPVDSIAIVTTSDSITADWRPRHAELLTRLSTAGASVVAFDIRFRNSSRHDEIFAAAVEAARARGTLVVAGANRLDGDSLALAPPLVNRIAAGLDCLGENPLQFSGIVPLLWSRRDGTAMQPAFALAVLQAWRGARFSADLDRREVVLTDSRGEIVDRIKLTKATTQTNESPGCPIMTRGSRYAEMLAVRAPLAEWRDPRRRFDYAAVLALPPERLEWARGRIVLVGAAVSEELASRDVGFESDTRYGVERHADAVATILANAEPIPVGRGAEYLLVAVLAALGAILAYRGLRSSYRRAAWTTAGVLTGLTMFSTALYWGGHLLLNLLYPFLAFALAFASVSLLRRRWLG